MLAVKRRYFILILLLVLLLLGWSVRLQLAELLITSPLIKAGLDDIAIDIEQVDLQQTQLSQLAFVWPGDSGRLTLYAQGIAIGYQPATLLNRHLDSIEIKKLDIHYKLKQEPSPREKKAHPVITAPPPRALLQVLRTALDDYLFFDKASIHQLSLNGKPFAQLDGKTLSLITSNNAGELSAEVTLLGVTTEISTADQSENFSQLFISRLSKNELDAELRLRKTTGIQPANIKLALKETEISGSYEISPGGLQTWLQPVVGRKDITNEIKLATLNGSIALNFAKEDALSVRLRSKTDSLAFTAVNAEDIVVDLKLIYLPVTSSDRLKILDGSYISAGKVKTAAASLTGSPINLEGELTSSNNNWKYQGTLKSKQITAGYQSQQLNLADITSTITADAQTLHAVGRFSPATVPGQFNFELTHSISSSTGTVAVKPAAAIELSAEQDKLSNLLTPWPYPFDLYTGSIELSADARWSKDKETRLDADISLKDGGGNAGSMVFSGLSFDHNLQILPAVHSSKASVIYLNTIDSGVAISNISLQLAATTSERGPLPRMIVRQAKGELLGGSFTADDMVYDLNRSSNGFLIKLKNIDLAEVVKTQQLENITATGRLDGILPVEITAEGINIAHGGLTNHIRGGTIRYIPQSGSAQLRQNTLTGITLDALEDFRYSDLQADVNYLPDGELTINIALKGISPQLDENRPVHLNINAEQNLVMLLKSLRFAQGVSDSIDDRVRRMYEKNSKQQVKQQQQ